VSTCLGTAALAPLPNCLRSSSKPAPHFWHADWTRNFYDLKPLCNGGASYTTPPSATGWTIVFQICGMANTVCVPQYEVTYNRGAAVQFLDNIVPVNGNCTNSSGAVQPCTPNCEVIGTGAPIISQLDPTNPAGGVNLSYYSVPENGKDSFQCPPDPLVSAACWRARARARPQFAPAVVDRCAPDTYRPCCPHRPLSPQHIHIHTHAPARRPRARATAS
jgi:hypothetical protein